MFFIGNPGFLFLDIRTAGHGYDSGGTTCKYFSSLLIFPHDLLILLFYKFCQWGRMADEDIADIYSIFYPVSILLTQLELYDKMLYIYKCKVGGFMATRAKVSQKWQVVIPKEVRKSLDLKPGDNLQFQVTKRGITIGKGTKSAFDRYFGYLNKKGSSDKIIREMRGDR